MNRPFQNSRYEYVTREIPTEIPRVISSETDREMGSQGWRRAWADISTEGTFIVYRRERTHG